MAFSPRDKMLAIHEQMKRDKKKNKLKEKRGRGVDRDEQELNAILFKVEERRRLDRMIAEEGKNTLAPFTRGITIEH